MRKITLLFVSLLLAGAQMLQAQRTVTGTVVSDSDKQGIPGVSVRVKGTSTGTTTDINGGFNISVPANSNYLILSFMGMETQEVAIDGKTTLDIVMTAAATALEGVVITGYGNIKKSTYTGSAEVVDNRQIEKIQASDVTKALEGVVPGVQAVGNSGQPGSGMNIRIRGIGSVYASNEPLYVVDGAPYAGNINSINPDDIESVSLLKDATSAALYGARGANGVVLITTKKGHTSDARLNFKATYGITTRGIPEYDVLDQAGYYEAMFTTIKNFYMTPESLGGLGFDEATARILAASVDNGVLANVGNYNAFLVDNDKLIDPITGKVNMGRGLKYNDSWEDEMLRRAGRQEYQFSASKGDDKNNYFASVSYLDEEGITPNTNFNRLTARLNSSNQLKKWFKLDMGLNASHQKTENNANDGTNAQSNPFSFSRNIPKIFPVYQYDMATGEKQFDADGNPLYDFGGADGMSPGTLGRPFNPNSNVVALLPLDKSEAQTEGLNARVATEFRIIEGLTLRLSGSMDLRNTYSYAWMNMKYGSAKSIGGRLGKNQYKALASTISEILTYARQFGDHNFSIMAGHENYSYNYQALQSEKTNFPYPSTDLSVGTVLSSLNSWTDNYRLEGYLFNASYDYEGKYYISGSFRRDGSSKFAPQSRWGNFWSVGGAWIVTREDFMKNATFLDVLKLRASYGSQGNDGVSGWYPWQGLYDMTYKNGNDPGAMHSSLDNADLRWEAQKMFNVGLDFRLFKRLSGAIEFYTKDNNDMLFAKPLASSTGISSIWQNVGQMRSSGVEFQINYDIIERDNLRWSVGLNATHWKSKMIKMAPGDSLGIAAGGSKRIMEGHSVYEFYIKEFAGVNENGQALYYTGKDKTEKTTSYTDATEYWTGKTSTPDIYGGFNTTLEFYGFDFSLLFSYSIGGWMYDYAYSNLMSMGFFNGNNMHKDILDSWSPTNNNQNLPQLNYAYESNNQGVSSRFLTSGSYFNLKNITLGYTIPTHVTQKIKISSIRAFITADNFFLKSARKGMDPQASMGGGVAEASYYPTKTLTFGLSLQF